jgi:uncharacterized protein (DUF885 family)
MSPPLVLLVVSLGASAAQPSAKEALDRLFAEAWEFELQENPLLATTVGRTDRNHLLPKVGAEEEARRAEARRAFLDRLRPIDRDALESSDRISYDMFERQIEDALSEHEFRSYLIPFNADSGFHMSLAQIPGRMPFRTPKDYESYIARLRALPEYMRQQIELMREGLESGMSVPRVTLEGYEATIEPHVVDSPEKSVFYAPFRSFPVGVPESERERLRESGLQAIMEGAVPAYRSFLDFFLTTYRPRARTTIGASELPRGREYYQFLIRSFTTLDLTAEEVHRTGLREVERIDREMREVLAQVGFQADFAAFLEFLRTDPRFYPKTAEELLKEASTIAKRMDAKLPSLFKTLPRLPYGVAPVPDHIAPKYTAGRYVGPALGSGAPGYYWVNTHKLESRTLYTLEALTLHEAVPGHHLQNALRLELEGLPDFRRFSGIGAYGEGWGLYSERLGLEAGFYTDPYSNFGRLTYEMWRACRLVVDTGMHAMGWTREQAIDYLASRTALSLHEVTTEIDRYISWPGQALSYKMGEIQIRELRERAEKALGEKFDVREFHDVILLEGPVPLPILEERVDAYIRSARGE